MKSFFSLIIKASARRISCFLLIVFLHSGVHTSAQSVRNILTKDGLPQSFVSGLVQDDSSFIWIGTRNGLARFDGMQFKVFQRNATDSTTIASNLIIWVKKDNRNKLWIEYESGAIDEMNPVTEKVRHLIQESQVANGDMHFIRRGWLVDEDDIFWGITKGSGFHYFDSRTGRSEKFTHGNSALGSDTVRGILGNKNQGIWILNDRQITLFDKKTKRFTHWPIPYQQDYGVFAESDAIAIDIHERKNGELMWGDRKNLYFFHPVNHQFRTVSLPTEAYLGVRWIRQGNDGFEYFENFARVYRYSDQTGVRSIGKTANELFADAKSFLVDRSGLIWLGTNAMGIQQIDLEIPFFQSLPYKKDFLTDMLQQEMGVDMHSLFNWYDIDQQFSQPSYYFRSVNSRNNRLYMALKETVCYYDTLQKKIIKLPKLPIAAESEKLKVAIRGITMLSDLSPLVIGYTGDILLYDSIANTWKPFIDPLLLRKKFGAALLPLDILADKKFIWISTEKDGLFRMDILTKEITQMKETRVAGSLPSNQLLCLRADPTDPNKLWIGSYQGLILLNKDSLSFKVFSLKEGLPDNTIYSILADNEGKLWLSTNKGICRFDPQTYVVRAFHTIHGLPGDEFNRFHQMKLPDGRLTFGSTDGWTIFNPLLMKSDSFDPAVAFTDMKINNRDVAGMQKNPLPLPINALQQLTLPYDQNTLSFGFAGLEFSQPQDIQYRYKLEGYDNDWVMAGSARSASYTRIPAGNYTLFVNASNTSGKWSSHVKELKLRIESPWYATRMAYLCYCIILAGLTWTFIRFRVSRMLMQQEMVLKEKESEQLKEVDEMKSRFFSNITHEFRTPLTLIMGPAEQLKTATDQHPKERKLADTIVQNAKQLLVLINRLMDLSKLEARALKLHEQRGYPADAVGSVVHSFSGDAENKQIQLRFENNTTATDCWFYADALERIVYNLVSNSLKFTGAGGRVDVILSMENKKLILIVKDNGVGIAEDKLPFIFDRFFQAVDESSLANQENNSGTGIGLSLVKELVNQMGGTIHVQSRKPGSMEHQSEGTINLQNQIAVSGDTSIIRSGTIFTLQLPFRDIEETDISNSEEAKVQLSEQQLETEQLPQLLLVEDNQQLAGFIQSILSDQYQVTHVVNGALGLDAAIEGMPDLIISDVMMPEMDGYEMTGRLKSDARTSHIPIILLTAKVTQENLIEGLEKGADDYLTKPFHPTELKLRMHNLLLRQEKLRARYRQEMVLPEVSGMQQAEQTVMPEKEILPQDIFLTNLYALLDEHLDDEQFGVDQLTDKMLLSRSSLHRKLKALTGMSTTEVVRNYRLKVATGFLKEGFNSSDTAYKTGFGSPAYFTKSFREVYGVTPGEYVRKLKA